MAATVVFSANVNTGPAGGAVPCRLIDLGSGSTPRLALEVMRAQDAMGSNVWSPGDFQSLMALLASYLIARGIIPA